MSGSVISAVSRSRIVLHQISRCLVMPAILVSCYGSYLNQGVWAQETPPAVEPPPALETGSRPVQEKPAQEKPAQETFAPSPDSVTPESATINPDKSRTPLLQVMDKAPIAHARDLSVAFRAASEKVLPSVVTILGQTKDIDPTQQALGFADEGDPSIYDSVGSGVIVDSSGLIITNNHVVAEAKRVLVRLYDGREIIAEDIRKDRDSDLATLRIKSDEPFPYTPLGNSDELGVGDWVLAIGSPFSLDSTVSAGIISGKGRMLEGMVRGQLIQTDASINPGNSGGPLVNLGGEVIGINTAIATRNGAFQGVGFAIPSNRVRWVTSELVDNGTVRRALLGVRTDRIPQSVAASWKLPPRGGAYVIQVTPNRPAAKAGIKVGDIIVQVGEYPIRTNTELGEIVEQLPVGEQMEVAILRDKERVVLPLKLESR
ncbi:MAG: trypsin-like peptidase domain-containing protein [Planctomycetaceae bacterium]|nr:trypsin-like peptidase domain-containing protein [Planctomycetaceae bacterium]